MSKAPKQKTKARAPKGRERVIVEGKVMYVNARGPQGVQGPGSLKYLIDANVLVHIANDVPGAGQMYAKLVAQPLGHVAISAITAHELRFMIPRGGASPKHVAGLQTIVREFPVEHFDLPAAHAAADVRA